MVWNVGGVLNHSITIDGALLIRFAVAGNSDAETEVIGLRTGLARPNPVLVRLPAKPSVLWICALTASGKGRGSGIMEERMRRFMKCRR